MSMKLEASEDDILYLIRTVAWVTLCELNCPNYFALDYF